jgi:hypothetical protein
MHAIADKGSGDNVSVLLVMFAGAPPSALGVEHRHYVSTSCKPPEQRPRELSKGSTPSFLVPSAAPNQPTQRPENGLVITSVATTPADDDDEDYGGMGVGLAASSSSQAAPEFGLEDVDSLLREIDDADADFPDNSGTRGRDPGGRAHARRSSWGDYESQGPPPQAAQAAKAASPKASGASPKLMRDLALEGEDDREILDFLLDDQNFGGPS